MSPKDFEPPGPLPYFSFLDLYGGEKKWEKSVKI